MARQEAPKDSKQPMDMNSEGGSPLFANPVPKLEMQPLVAGAAVPGVPVLDSDGVQKSGVIPH